MWADVVLVIVAATAATAAIALGVRRSRQSDLGDDLTPERPTLLAANRPVVSVLYEAADAIESSGFRCADGLRDLAKVIQLSATTKVDGKLTARMAAFVDDHGGAVRREAQRILDTKEA